MVISSTVPVWLTNNAEGRHIRESDAIFDAGGIYPSSISPRTNTNKGINKIRSF